MSTTVNEILGFLGLPPAQTDGPVARAAALSSAGPDAVTFCNRAPRPVDAALVLAESDGDFGAARVALVPNARLAFVRVVGRFFAPPEPPPGIHPTAVIDESATLGNHVRIGPGCSVGPNAIIGDDALLHAGVHVGRGVRLGRRVTVNAGTVIGGDGFGYERDERDRWVAFPQLGAVVIEDDVHIGANSCVDRGALDDTWIGTGVRIDNFVHVAHGVRLGRHSAVAAHAMLAGSVTIGERVWIAPSVCVRDGLTIGDDAFVGLGAVVVRSVAPGSVVMGNPARPR
jgi:UDP-3-O-[3-hydroxymyristoyl] glucosamine N-acyltransferase